MAEHNQTFDSFNEWVSKAPSWLTRHPDYNNGAFRAICFDAKGRYVTIGADFHRARDEDAFPVYWYWPDQIPKMAMLLRRMSNTDVEDVSDTGQLIKLFCDKAREIIK